MIIVSLGLCNEKSNFRYKPFKSKDHLKSQFFFFDSYETEKKYIQNYKQWINGSLKKY